ncbi:DUF6958 family protein [Cyclobacterium marinum]|uniref:Uncharacterized protein n=1 Tax=Cyclobacterium marinum (strain ATCC 25205 / DSM 745 / LMG 13164 / NCIMB 1802) TaxID=880070 RepID=G0IYY5_CYCMS|nr:hypothetical protein [Cyclobacterium marinum]AEL28130.1 hypothetical protein Cycma_4428 [Cyclobacterium marinum DSM 745]
MEDRLLTLHPEGKKGVNILVSKYTIMKEFILKTLSEREKISYKELNKLAIASLKDSFEGSVAWYLVSVKLDLEARKIIERIPGTSPHLLRLCKKIG